MKLSDLEDYDKLQNAFDRLENKIEARFNQLDARITALDGKIDRVRNSLWIVVAVSLAQIIAVLVVALKILL